MSWNHQHFASVDELSSAVSAKDSFTNPENFQKAKMYAFENRDRDADWFGVNGANAVHRARVEGNESLEQLIESFYGRIKAKLPKAKSCQRVRRRGAMGDEVDVHAMLRGNFDRAWSTTARDFKRGNAAIRIVVDVGGNAGVSADTLRWRGVAGLSLAKVLQDAGYSVEVVAAFACENFTIREEDHQTTTIVVKPRSVRFNLKFLAATVALSGFFRTLGFAALALTADKLGTTTVKHMGRSVSVEEHLPVPSNVTQLAVSHAVDSERSALEWIEEAIKLIQAA